MKKIILLAFFVAVLLVVIFLYTSRSTSDAIYNKDIITIPVSVHLVDDDSYHYTTDRNLMNIIKLFEETNQIWEQAQIEFIIEDIDTIEIDSNEFNSVFSGDIETLIKRNDFDSGMINGYFAKYFNANGVAFPPQGIFVIADLTTVNDYRTTAHELGHLLGLHHVEGRGNLMFKGANGEVLSQEEVNIARRNAMRVYEIKKKKQELVIGE